MSSSASDKANRLKISCSACSQKMDVTELEPFSKIKCVACGATLVVPKRLAQFMLLSPMGSGGMGAVYRAIDTSLNRQVAIKLMQTEMASDPHFIENFSREARAAAALNHHNIAQIYSFGQEQGQYFLAMELVDRGSLDDIIASKKPLTEAQVIEIGLQVASALRSAWTRGLVHHDIKPGNILFNDEGVAKIVDFGLAQFARDTHPGGVPQLSGVWGTPYYVAPEKLDGKREDFRSDIYSLGATLYHALAGQPPFEGTDLLEVAQRRLKEVPLSMRRYRRDVSEATAKILARMLARKPEERYANYDELLSDLTAAKRAALQGHRKANEAHQELRRARRAQMFKRVAVVAVLAVGVGWGVTHLNALSKLPLIGNLITAIRVKDGEKSGVSTIPSGPGPRRGGDAPVGNVNLDAWQKNFDAALGHLAQGNYTQSLDDCSAILTTPGLPRRHKDITIFVLGLGQSLSGLTEKSSSTFGVLVGNKPLEDVPQNLSAETAIALLASVMTDQFPQEKLVASFNNLPSGARALARFTLGVRNLSGAETEQAAAIGYFKDYLAAPKLDDAAWSWVDRLRPAAQQFGGEYDALQTALAAARQLREQEKWAEAAARLDLAQFKPPLTTTAFVARANARKKEYVDEIESQKRTAVQKTAEKFDAEKKIIGLVEAQITPLIPIYSFAAVVVAYEKIAPQITTNDGKALVEKKIKTYQLLADLKTQTITEIPKKPLPPNTLTVGGRLIADRLIRATDAEAFVQNPFGESAMPWKNFPPEELAKVFRFYLSPPPASAEPTVRAAVSQRYLALAIFYDAFRLDTTEAGGLAAAAIQIYPQNKDLVRSFFPAVE